ncbi:MAG: glycosyltransferase [Gemmatimonadaceae bacterium]|nr:glycosyltransferase [Gemmatimonadaceae bacterium]
MTPDTTRVTDKLYADATPTLPRTRILYVYPDTMGPSATRERNALHFLSAFLCGDMIPVFVPRRHDEARVLAETKDAIGDFVLHPVNTSVRIPILKQLIEATRMLATARRLRLQLRRRGQRYDAIVAHGPYRTGFVGLLLSRLWRLPLVVEFPGHPTRALALDRSVVGRVKSALAPALVGIIAKHVEGVRLLYPTQLDGVVSLRSEATPHRVHVFHEFVPVGSIRPGSVKKPVILFVGFPWYLKGVDILIAAFHRLCNDFPDVKLKIVGFCPDRAPWETLAKGNPNIEFLGPQLNTAIAELMAESQVFVLPSRSEAMGRVLLESMAAGTPVVASRVDGIPHYVFDDVDGLLFDSEDVTGLEAQLRRLLLSAALRERLSVEALRKVNETYSEDAYARAFSSMVRNAIAERRRRQVRQHH